MFTKIMTCLCVSEYQDKEYGKMLRLFNQMKTVGMWRCTICGKEKQQ